MSEIKNFAEANKVLASFVGNNGKTKDSLENMQALVRAVGDPQDNLKIIHVAGTSGKTSTSYYAAAMLQATGKTVGLTVSPHVREVNERLQINLEPLEETKYCQAFSEFLSLVKKSSVRPSYFEFLVGFAYWYFAKTKVDYAVIEVGIGGLFDGTNVINRVDKVCVISDIGYDHMNLLGTSLSEIAAQKAGIITDHNAVFTHLQSRDVMKKIEEKCRDEHAQLHMVAQDEYLDAPKALPLFQQRNWPLAKVVFQYLAARDNLRITTDNLRKTTHIVIPGRMETFNIGGHVLILDGGHNQQKIEALTASLRQMYPKDNIAALVAFAGHKEQFEKSIRAVTKLASRLIFTSFHVEQDAKRSAVDPKVLGRMTKELGYQSYEIEADEQRAYQQLLKRPEKILLVTGSLYLVSAIRSLIEQPDNE